MRFRSSNPVYRNVMRSESFDMAESVTYQGVATKTFLLVCLALFSGTLIAINFINYSVVSTPLVIISVIAAFIAVIVGTINVRASLICSIIYALAEGVTLGLVSAIYVLAFGDFIVPVALFMTLAVVMTMALLYSTKIIRVTAGFRSFLYTTLITMVVGSLVLFILSLFGINFLANSLGLYIGVCILSAVVASLYLTIDFANIGNCVEQNVSKEYEWTLALSLMVTVVWLYVEILRLVAILYNRKRWNICFIFFMLLHKPLINISI